MIQLLATHLQDIFQHAESTYPEECCGILLGSLTETQKTVAEVILTENAWNPDTALDFSESKLDDEVDNSISNTIGFSKRRRYAIAPEVMLKAQKSARDSGMNIIGIFHSHPDYPAEPSEFDRNYAWQEYSYIIVSVRDGKAAEINSWVLNSENQFQAEELWEVRSQK
ncbi:Mov34/MPN/PAD-1 family protein [Mastigocoleus testarum]|uniref:MPN domain-containing protein n=1 Tax=Mastigocoleus testarum BC008 TaxID=371196 RepID=A0A0V7ZSF1_9CYAN|nr:M67 family metallopeptidase [Mastigocoleus testarum]KST67523.1 hypothetical protein BC008_30475 [Mastigocoleus testarum BC008]